MSGQLDGVRIEVYMILGVMMPLANLLKKDIECKHCNTRRFRSTSRFCDNCGEELTGQNQFIEAYDRQNHSFKDKDGNRMLMSVREIDEEYVLIGLECASSPAHFANFNVVKHSGLPDKHTFGEIQEKIKKIPGMDLLNAQWGIFAHVSK